METKVSLAAVGIFVIVLAVAGIAGGLWLASGTYHRKVYDLYETYMTESVAGLNVNATVRYRGVDVGLVRAVGLAPDNVEQVRVTLAIERGTPVKTDTVATLRTLGLTGIAFIELNGGRRESPALQAAPGQKLPVIQSAPSLIAGLETSVPALTASHGPQRMRGLIRRGRGAPAAGPAAAPRGCAPARRPRVASWPSGRAAHPPARASRAARRR